MISERIDLTQNRMFSTNNQQVMDILNHYIKGRIPWKDTFKTIRSDSDLEGTPYKEIILLGNREERQHKQLCLDAISREKCDRCGDIISKFPWAHRWGLCEKCSDEMEATYGPNHRIPWDMKYFRNIFENSEEILEI